MFEMKELSENELSSSCLLLLMGQWSGFLREIGLGFGSAVDEEYRSQCVRLSEARDTITHKIYLLKTNLRLLTVLWLEQLLVQAVSCSNMREE